MNLVSHHHLTVKEYDDGTVKTSLTRLDPATRRMTCESLLDFRQSEEAPLTTAEIMLMSAAERVARQLGYEVELPW